MSKKKFNGVRVYKTYYFRPGSQDPIVDALRTVLKDEAAARGTSIKALANRACDLSGVSRSTKGNWLAGKTRRPQFATLNAFARAIDHELTLVERSTKKR
jgi:transcriptional regulator with XRE-family HTH domain